jgi:hypothetical protein
MPCRLSYRASGAFLRMKMNPNDQTTSDTLSERLNGKTYRALAAELGYPESAIGMLSDMIHKHPEKVSARNKKELRIRLGLEKREVRPPCFRPRLSLDKTERRAQLLKLLEDCE